MRRKPSYLSMTGAGCVSAGRAQAEQLELGRILKGLDPDQRKRGRPYADTSIWQRELTSTPRLPMTHPEPSTRSTGPPGDPDIRSALLRRLKAGHDAVPTRLIEEFWIPVSHERADVVEVNGLLSGFEIKSARDGLARLPRQVAAFNAVFDRMSLVCDSRHLSGAAALVPSWWGVILVEARGEAIWLQALREPGANPDPDPEARLRLLWKGELAAALTAGGLPCANQNRAQMRSTLAERVTADEIARIVRSALLSRPLDARRWGSKARRPLGNEA